MKEELEIFHSDNTIVLKPIILDDLKVNDFKRKPNKFKKILLIIGSFFTICIASGLFLLYGPWNYFRELLITTAMTTMNHQYLATWFYDDKTIEEIMSKNVVVESGENSDSNAITVTKKDIVGNVKYESIYEEQILKKDKNNSLYKVIDIKGNGYKGYLVVIYDPSKIKIATSKYLGNQGEKITAIAKKNNARIAINAGGFIDLEGHGNGGYPTGSIIKDGKLVWRSNGPSINGGIIGFNKDNILVLTKKSAEQALAEGVRDAVEFGPFLIVNGKASFIRGNGGWGVAPRTAIGQRQDGIVLFLIIDGRQVSSIGADMVDLTEIMQRYKAYNAANLDGGSSTGLTVEGILKNKPSGKTPTGERHLPNAFIVVDE